MQFRILGRLEVVADSGDVTPARPKQRALLALLLLHANEVVASDRIMDALWGETPPSTALTALHGHVSALRKQIGKDTIETHATGYLLRVDTADIDVGRFETLLEDARRERDPGRRATQLREALDLFRGEPLAEFRYETFAQDEIARLDEMHLSALEERIEADLAAGRHGELAPELERLIAAHPVRERLRAQLMLALYRAGRQADALRVYQLGRRALVDELGVEPGPALRKLERQILAQDRALDLQPAEQRPGTVTFLFTDIEGSTALLQDLGERYADALTTHRRLLRRAFARHGGSEIDTQGDAFFIAFPSARDAVRAAHDAQQALGAEPWPNRQVRVRIGIHTCEARPTEEGYVGVGVHRAARICAAGHGGQVLVSHTTHDLLEEEPLEEASLRDLGPHRLKDLAQPERIFQLVAEGLEEGFPPLDTLDGRATNLPTQLTPLIGRERELAQVRDRLVADEIRILTLTGSGGTGKTRLALQAAADSLGSFPSGTFFVALAPLANAELVLPTIAQVLGLRVPRGQALGHFLADYFAERKLLLVLDNFEHVVAAAPDVARLVAAAPGLKVLATSREPLHVSGERALPVPPLEMPEADAGWEALAVNEAVALFVDRAQAIRPDFDLTEANAPAVAAICRKLDGLPLAIELAAARIPLFPPAALLARLDERLAVLTGGARDRPGRHQTLRATLDWSYELLSAPRRRLFARLAVFAGGWTLETAETVCDGDLDVVDGLASLIDKSLVRLEGSEEEPRFAMLETIREYGLEKLRQLGEERAVRDRHLAWSLAFAERAEPELRGPEQKAWLDRLHAELDNFRAALDWSRSHDPEACLRLASALLEFWVVRADWSEGREWIEQALSVVADIDPAVRMKALRAVAELADVLSDYPSSTRYYEESLEIARALGNPRGIADAVRGLAHERARVGLPVETQRPLLEEAVEIYRELGDEPSLARSLGGIAWTERDLRRGRELKEEALAIYRRLGNRESVGWALLQAGVYAQYVGDFSAAGTAYVEARSIGEELGYTRMIARACDLLGANALWQGELDEARRFYERSVPLWRECGHRNGLADSLRGLGTVARFEGDLEAATSLFEESLEVCREIGYRAGEAHALLGLSALASDRAELGDAIHLHREALALWRDMDDAESVGMTLWRLGGLAAIEGRFEIAARLLGASEALREEVGAIVPPCDACDYERAVREAQSGLDSKAFAAAWSAGRRLQLSEAADLGMAVEALA